MYQKDPELRFNFDDPSSPHFLVPAHIPEKSAILDVGCNTGYIGGYLIKNKRCICDGVDYNKEFLKKARKKGYRKTMALDLYSNNFHIEKKYDAILFLDILEHLPNPYDILKKITSENLNPGGIVIISLPNAARIEFRLKLLLGIFDYEKSGIMSQDHLRFFTKNSASQMIQKAGLKIVDILPTGMGSKFTLFDTLLSFQFIFICRKSEK